MARGLTEKQVQPREPSGRTLPISIFLQRLRRSSYWWMDVGSSGYAQPDSNSYSHSYANINPNTDPNGYGYSYPNCYGYTHADTNGHANSSLACDSHIDAAAAPTRHGHRDSNIYGYSYSYVYCHCVRDRDGYCHGHCYTYCDADNYAPIHSYAETQPVATASSHSSAQAIGCLAWGFDLILAKPPATLGIRYHDQKNIDRVHPPIASAARKQLRHFGDAIENGARPDRHFAKDDRRNRNGHDGSQYQSVEWNWLRVAQCRLLAIRGRGKSILQHSRIQRPFARSRSRLHSAPAATAVCASF